MGGGGERWEVRGGGGGRGGGRWKKVEGGVERWGELEGAGGGGGFLDSGLCRFESVHCAQKAKAALNGADIYAGCCTLKIEYARVSPEPL